MQIADEGQNAFMDAYSDLLDISNSTRSMSRTNGYVSGKHPRTGRSANAKTAKFDILETSIAEPDRQRAAKRALRSIIQNIQDCEKNGMRTEEHFVSWLETIDKVKEAVVNTQS